MAEPPFLVNPRAIYMVDLLFVLFFALEEHTLRYLDAVVCVEANYDAYTRVHCIDWRRNSVEIP